MSDDFLSNGVDPLLLGPLSFENIGKALWLLLKNKSMLVLKT